MTKEELIEVLDIYITPLYNLIGAALAVVMLFAVVYLVIKPFIGRSV